MTMMWSLALGQVTDVGEARDVTGKGTSIKLTTAGGRVCYIADSETEQVEWLSALEGAVAKIVKQVRALCVHEAEGLGGTSSGAV